jgi:hypothetical protein
MKIQLSENDKDTTFAEQAEAPQAGFFAEFWQFLRYNKKWWMLPILLLLVALAIFIMLGSTGAAPFIYTLF